MARNLAKQTKQATDVRCKPCSNGRHYPDCEERACGCWCLLRTREVLPNARIGKPAMGWSRHHKDPLYLLQRMRDHHMQVRFGRDGTVWFKPSVKKLDDHMRALLSEYRREVVSLFVPIPPHWSPNRPFWVLGGISACGVCGRSTAQWNPLGQCQHPTCGFINQNVWVPSRGTVEV